DNARRQIVGNERQENIVGIVELTAVCLLGKTDSFGSGRVELLLCMLVLLCCLLRWINASRIGLREPGGRGFAFLKGSIVVPHNSSIIRARLHLRHGAWIENHRRLLEVVKGENHSTDKEDEHLQRYLRHPVEQQAHTAVLQ